MIPPRKVTALLSISMIKVFNLGDCCGRSSWSLLYERSHKRVFWASWKPAEWMTSTLALALWLQSYSAIRHYRNRVIVSHSSQDHEWIWQWIFQLWVCLRALLSGGSNMPLVSVRKRMAQVWPWDKAGSPISSSTCSTYFIPETKQGWARCYLDGRPPGKYAWLEPSDKRHDFLRIIPAYYQCSPALAPPQVKGCSNFVLWSVVTHTNRICQAYYPMVRVKTSKAEWRTGQEAATWAGASRGGTNRNLRSWGGRAPGLWGWGDQGQAAAVERWWKERGE